jgi:hypothetical protein
MTIIDEGRRLRNEVMKLRPDRHRRYPQGLRRRILDWVDRASKAGQYEWECAKLVGLRTWRFTNWRKMEAARAKKLQPESLALVPVEAPVMTASSAGLMLCAPCGYRVEGLTLAEVVTLLRELA